MTPHEVLGIPTTASPDEIKTAYRRACARSHPDRGGTEDAFQAVQAAYDKLQKQPCALCGGKGTIKTKRGPFVSKERCPHCWKTILNNK